MKVLFSGFKDSKHSKGGGYDKIVNIDLDKRVLLSNHYLGGSAPIASSMSRVPFYLLDIHTRMLRHNYDITHLFYGELTTLPFLPYRKSKKHKTVITLHLKVEDHRCVNLYLNQLKNFDGIIVLSSGQKEILESKYGIKSTFIPHGFSKPVFKVVDVKDSNNSEIDLSKINISIIGSNYRDFDTLKFVLNEFSTNANIHFHLIGVPEDIKEYAKGIPNVSIYCRLNDDEFYSVISKVDYNFLPLTFATANNTLLEAQYLNTPSILPSIAGVSDYAAPTPYNMFYSSRDELVDIIRNLNKKTISTELENYTKLHFDWDVVYSSLIKYYNEILTEV